jgi:hypothetical protein
VVDLRDVLVLADLVGIEVAEQLAEVEIVAHGLARAARSAAAEDRETTLVHEARAHEGQQGEQRRGGITAGIADERRDLRGWPEQLGQSIEDAGRRAMCGGQIDCAHASGAELRRPRERGFVRNGEHDRRTLVRDLGGRRDRVASLDRHRAHAGMMQQECMQQLADVPLGADDPDRVLGRVFHRRAGRIANACNTVHRGSRQAGLRTFPHRSMKCA